MKQSIIKNTIKIDGMTCTGCELRIEKKLKTLKGVINVAAKYSTATIDISFYENEISTDSIIKEIKSLDYKVVGVSAKLDKNKASGRSSSINQLLGISIIILALYLIIKNTIGFNFIPQVNQNMGLGILFVVGLITSLHCIAMCGGINLSQCVSNKVDDSESNKFKKLKPSFLYNAGRVISYTVIGGIVGALGSVVSFSGAAKGVVAILSGLFMVIMGLNMLNIFPWLRKFNPRMPKIFGRKINANKHNHGPFIVGLLNGLMPCGPLQAMQLYALGTGSFFNGAIAMFIFSLGTVPLMFGFGAISSFLSSKFTHKMMKVSAVLVIILGIVLVSRGLNLSGISVLAASAPASSSNIAKVEGNVQVITTKFTDGKYVPIVVKKGVPVKWIINVTESDLNGCNNPVTIPKYNIKKVLVPGDNIINFTPQDEGTIKYTCWMGMVSSTITVVADTTKAAAVVGASNAPSQQSSVAGGCCAAGANATKFIGGKIPTDDIQIAKIVNNVQEVTITVNDQGYSPAVVVVQKGVKTKIKFIAEKLNSCNYIVSFPELGGQLDLKNNTGTSEFTPVKDFTFQCGMGMLHGYVKVVDDVNNINLDNIKKDVAAFKPAQGGGGCCG